VSDNVGKSEYAFKFSSRHGQFGFPSLSRLAWSWSFLQTILRVRNGVKGGPLR